MITINVRLPKLPVDVRVMFAFVLFYFILMFVATFFVFLLL